MFLQAFLVSITVTLVGSQLALFMTTLAAYPLFKPRLRGRKFFIILYLFTMLFSGGLIPSYLLYFESLPNSLEESAKIDGAINMTTLARIILPLSMPVLAAIGLFYAVTFWKDYFTSLIYFNSAELKQLQLYLKELFVSSTDAFMRTNVDASLNVSPQSIQAASIILATLPIILVYPWLQKYFVKGVLVGSIKG
jgi:putative aldouronate transport system permease protein